MSDIKIELLEVHFDVVGDDEQTFVRLFEKYINRWTRMQRDDGRSCLRATHDVICNLVRLRWQIRILGLARHPTGRRNRNDYFSRHFTSPIRSGE